MRINAVNVLNFSTNYTQNKTTNPNFKGAVVAEALERAKYPNSSMEWKQKCWSLVQAVIKEPVQNIKDHNIMFKLSNDSQVLSKLMDFFNYGMNKYLYSGQRIEIVNDGKGTVLQIARDNNVLGYDASYLQFSSGNKYAQFGIADVYNNGQKLSFYRDETIYVDFYNNGGFRKVAPTLQTPKYFKKDGSRDYFGGLKDLINGF